MIETKDVVISGGGIAGLVAATAFGDAGFDVLCVEPNPPIAENSAKGVDLRTTAYLQPAQEFFGKNWCLETCENAFCTLTNYARLGRRRGKISNKRTLMLETSLTNLSGGMLEIGRCVPAL